MSDRTGICNLALILLGSEPITSIEDNINSARTLKTVYASVRDSELRNGVWKFAKNRARLVELADKPAFEFGHQFELPYDFIRLLDGGSFYGVADLSDYRSTHSAFSIEGQAILTNIGSPLNIIYTRRVDDETLFDPCFAMMFAAQLAFICCDKLTQSDSKKQIAWDTYQEYLKRAIRSGSLETPPKYPNDNSWIISRLG